jgi:hypothetical protein
MAFSNAAQRVMRNSGLPDEKITSALSLVYQFVYGFSTIEGRFSALCRTLGITQDELLEEVMSSVEERPEFDESRKTMEASRGQTVEEMREREFTTALDFAIAGIEALRDAPSPRAGRAAEGTTGGERPGGTAVMPPPEAPRPALAWMSSSTRRVVPIAAMPAATTWL